MSIRLVEDERKRIFLRGNQISDFYHYVNNRDKGISHSQIVDWEIKCDSNEVRGYGSKAIARLFNIYRKIFELEVPLVVFNKEFTRNKTRNLVHDKRTGLGILNSGFPEEEVAYLDSIYVRGYGLSSNFDTFSIDLIERMRDLPPWEIEKYYPPSMKRIESFIQDLPGSKEEALDENIILFPALQSRPKISLQGRLGPHALSK